MIVESAFKISLNDSISLLKKLNLYKGVGPKNIGNYSTEFKKISRTNKHIDIYNSIRDNLDYEIILNDDSFFQFSRSENYLRFSFIENPNFSYTKYDFLKIIFSYEDITEFTNEDINELIDENEFEQFLNEQEVNSNLTYLRYDYDVKGYSPLLHSCSHLHIGLNENFRISSSLVLTPLQFVMFAVKQKYYENWKIYYNSSKLDDFSDVLLDSKKKCIVINDKSIWSEIEQNEIFIA